jgi:hypothetical protein
MDRRRRLHRQIPLRKPARRLSLQGLEGSGRVIYVGSLGKILHPRLRIGYMVTPEHAVDTVRPLSTYGSREPAARPSLFLGLACVSNDWIARPFGSLIRAIERGMKAGPAQAA